MIRRRGGLLRTAAIVGTAQAVSGNVAHKQQQKFAAQDAATQQAAAAAAPAAPTTSSVDDQVAQLQKLAELKDQGILTQAEFDTKKQQILGL